MNTKKESEPNLTEWNTPSLRDAYSIGAKGGPIIELERLAFEEYMRGHCWALGGKWDGETYVADDETVFHYNAHAMQTRQLWAVWRDRAAIANGFK